MTRKDAAADFFGEENVPREAITMGVATILEAREIVILATGEHKAEIVRRAVEGEVDHEVAATFLQRHANTTFYLDPAAAASLTRVATPWLVGSMDWTEAAAVRAVVWLSRETGKAILKLTQRDYAEHRLSSLVAAPRIARRAQRRRLQRPGRQDPGPLQAARGQADRLLLAPSR